VPKDLPPRLLKLVRKFQAVEGNQELSPGLYIASHGIGGLQCNAPCVPGPAGEPRLKQIAGREPPKKPVRECWFVCGRRAGKDSIASLIAGYTAAFFEPSGRLRRGERASVMCLACDREQAGIVLNYVRSYFQDIPFLKRVVTNETATGLELSNGVDIVIATNDYRSVRGRAVAVAILDECAFWRDDRSAAPDAETYNAIVPGTVTVGGSNGWCRASLRTASRTTTVTA
jgi:hypothetical protein